jgi:rhodanese-related sulfurtransferase
VRCQVLAAALILLALSPAAADHPPTYAILTIDADWLKILLDKGSQIVVVDMRPPAAFNGGHIPGARSISLDDPVERLGELPKDRLVVLYCDCPMDEISPAFQTLRFFKFPHVLVLHGGLAAWVERGYPVTK